MEELTYKMAQLLIIQPKKIALPLQLLITQKLYLRNSKNKIAVKCSTN